MSAGSLPGHTYHRASQLGSGTFGSVVVVYNDEGFEFALKLFNNDDEGDHSDADSYRPPGALNIGVLREISALRLLREYSGHVNIVQLVDVQTDWDDEEDGGAGTGGCLSIALPLYKSGSLQDAIKKGFFRSYPRKVKVAVAHGILSAVTYVSL
jgi:serine/threonine protein kinase